MKKLLSVLLMTVATTAFAVDTHADAAAAKGETKQVCVDVKKDGKEVKDPKTGKVKQSCKTMKVHKKHEGTAIPTK